MKVEIVGITSCNPNVIKNIKKEDLMLQAGHSANICYTQKDWQEIAKENEEKTLKRADGNKVNLHHSVFGHSHISLYFTNIPKLVAMLINNEHEYNTSEKSARYTKMHPSEKELELYNKWVAIFEKVICETYPSVPYVEQRYHKLAMENARYMLSCMTLASMEYTTSQRQWCYLYAFAKKMVAKKTDNELIKMVKPSLKEFMNCLEQTGIIDPSLIDFHNREFSLITEQNWEQPEIFSNVYSTNYQASIACVAQNQRHRSLYHQVYLPEERKYFIPPIISQDEKLTKEWLKDISSLENVIPQGTLLNVNERGIYESFVMRIEERLCTCAQLETTQVNYEILTKYVNELKKSTNPYDKYLEERLAKYLTGARCLTMNHFTCPSPCHFQEGMQLKRKI